MKTHSAADPITLFSVRTGPITAGPGATSNISAENLGKGFAEIFEGFSKGTETANAASEGQARTAAPSIPATPWMGTFAVEQGPAASEAPSGAIAVEHPQDPFLLTEGGQQKAPVHIDLRQPSLRATSAPGQGEAAQSQDETPVASISQSEKPNAQKALSEHDHRNEKLETESTQLNSDQSNAVPLMTVVQKFKTDRNESLVPSETGVSAGETTSDVTPDMPAIAPRLPQEQGARESRETPAETLASAPPKVPHDVSDGPENHATVQVDGDTAPHEQGRPYEKTMRMGPPIKAEEIHRLATQNDGLSFDAVEQSEPDQAPPSRSRDTARETRTGDNIVSGTRIDATKSAGSRGVESRTDAIPEFLLAKVPDVRVGSGLFVENFVSVPRQNPPPWPGSAEPDAEAPQNRAEVAVPNPPLPSDTSARIDNDTTAAHRVSSPATAGDARLDIGTSTIPPNAAVDLSDIRQGQGPLGKATQSALPTALGTPSILPIPTETEAALVQVRWEAPSVDQGRRIFGASPFDETADARPQGSTTGLPSATIPRAATAFVAEQPARASGSIGEQRTLRGDPMTVTSNPIPSREEVQSHPFVGPLVTPAPQSSTKEHASAERLNFNAPSQPLAAQWQEMSDAEPRMGPADVQGRVQNEDVATAAPQPHDVPTSEPETARDDGTSPAASRTSSRRASFSPPATQGEDKVSPASAATSKPVHAAAAMTEPSVRSNESPDLALQSKANPRSSPQGIVAPSANLEDGEARLTLQPPIARSNNLSLHPPSPRQPAAEAARFNAPDTTSFPARNETGYIKDQMAPSVGTPRSDADATQATRIEATHTNAAPPPIEEGAKAQLATRISIGQETRGTPQSEVGQPVRSTPRPEPAGTSPGTPPQAEQQGESDVHHASPRTMPIPKNEPFRQSTDTPSPLTERGDVVSPRADQAQIKAASTPRKETMAAPMAIGSGQHDSGGQSKLPDTHVDETGAKLSTDAPALPTRTTFSRDQGAAKSERVSRSVRHAEIQTMAQREHATSSSEAKAVLPQTGETTSKEALQKLNELAGQSALSRSSLTQTPHGDPRQISAAAGQPMPTEDFAAARGTNLPLGGQPEAPRDISAKPSNASFLPSEPINAEPVEGSWRVSQTPTRPRHSEMQTMAQPEPAASPAETKAVPPQIGETSSKEALQKLNELASQSALSRSSLTQTPHGDPRQTLAAAGQPMPTEDFAAARGINLPLGSQPEAPRDIPAKPSNTRSMPPEQTNVEPVESLRQVPQTSVPPSAVPQSQRAIRDVSEQRPEHAARQQSPVSTTNFVSATKKARSSTSGQAADATSTNPDTAATTVHTESVAPEPGPDRVMTVTSPEQAPAATHGSAAHRTSVTHSVGHQLAHAAANANDRTVELTLSPEELGKVRMTLQAGDSSIVVSVQADRSETLDLMRRNIDSLARDFRELGYSDVSFSFGEQTARQDGSSGQNAPPPERAEHETSTRFHGATLALQPQLREASKGLDLRI